MSTLSFIIYGIIVFYIRKNIPHFSNITFWFLWDIFDWKYSITMNNVTVIWKHILMLFSMQYTECWYSICVSIALIEMLHYPAKTIKVAFSYSDNGTLTVMRSYFSIEYNGKCTIVINVDFWKNILYSAFY